MLRDVEQVGHRAVSLKNEPWRIGDDGVAERCRDLFGRLVGASGDEIAITPSTSYAISMVAHNLGRMGYVKPGDAVFVLENQMSSNVYPWQRICRETKAQLLAVPMPAAGGMWTEALLSAAAAFRRKGGRVAVFAVPHYLWTDGSGPVDLTRLGQFCREVNGNERRALLVVDATQSLGAVPIDVHSAGIDFLASSVHKWLFGPYGMSFLYAAEEFSRDPRSEPLVQDEHNRAGASGDICLEFELSRPGYAEEFQPGARKFDAGGRHNPILLPMIEAALTQVLTWGPTRIQATTAVLVARVEAGARQLGLDMPAHHAPHIVGVGAGAQDVPPGSVNTSSLRTQWADDASAFLKTRRIYVSSRAGVLRVAPNVYNSLKDVDVFLAALKEFTLLRRSGAKL